MAERTERDIVKYNQGRVRGQQEGLTTGYVTAYETTRDELTAVVNAATDFEDLRSMLIARFGLKLV